MFVCTLGFGLGEAELDYGYCDKRHGHGYRKASPSEANRKRIKLEKTSLQYIVHDVN